MVHGGHRVNLFYPCPCPLSILLWPVEGTSSLSGPVLATMSDMDEAKSRPRGRLVTILAGIAVVVVGVILIPYVKEIIHRYGLGSLEERLEGRLEGRWAPVGEGGQLEARKGIEFLGGGRLVDLASAQELSFTVEADTLLVTIPDEKPPQTLRVPVSWQGSPETRSNTFGVSLRRTSERQEARRGTPSSIAEIRS